MAGSRDDRRLRLDPVCLIRPTRATLIRAGLVTTLLVAAAVLAVTGNGQRRPSAQAGCAGSAPAVRTPGPAAGERGPAAAGTDPPQDGALAVEEGQPGDKALARLAVPAGSVGVVVTLAEPAALDVLRAGDRVDLLEVAPEIRAPTLAADALVLATPGSTGSGSTGLYLALRPDRARAVMARPPGTRFAVLVRSGGRR